ncbi:cell division protein FtsQ [Marinifilum sp. N1E240]|uniref:cell division protein FtsQ/DivIB n=1 Tax=Marinifilum sp. N1E240 TaxID=2608082 RepID=UPI00128BF54C|nr:cell division protein FtsQ [Marinifilum sp. N1E240]MPQ48628.1 cell division protein FtsQ [Marinifilum sp. N1E240]
MLRKITVILVWVSLLGYLIVSFSFVSDKKEELTFSAIKVKVQDSVRSGFVSNRDVEKIVKKKYPNWEGNSISSVNKEILEDMIDEVPYVKKSEVYSSLSGKLIVEIHQRKPIVRILKGKGYYIDEEGKKMPLSTKFTSRVLVVSGAVNDILIKEELLELVKFITNDEFWKSQITQVHVTSGKEYILVPRVGAHKIELGSVENYQKKFQKLYALYTSGFSKTGWNKYKRISLKYENQVVCTKKN